MSDGKMPHQIECEPGNYAWCMCGLSSKFPHCDGEHARQNTGKTPHIHIVGKPTTIYICACGKSDRKPFCDGSHKTKSEGQ